MRPHLLSLALLLLALLAAASAQAVSWNGVCDTGGLNATLVATGVQTQFFPPSVATDGSKIGVLFVDSSFMLNVSFSTDQGVTFGVPVNVAENGKHFSLHHVGGKWIAVYAAPTYVASRTSSDGVTWDPEQVVTLYGSSATADVVAAVAAPQLNVVAAFYTIGQFLFAEYVGSSDGKWKSFGSCPHYNTTAALDCFGTTPVNVSAQSTLAAAWDGSQFLVVFEQSDVPGLGAQTGSTGSFTTPVPSSGNVTGFYDDFQSATLFSNGKAGSFMLAGTNSNGNVIAQTTTTHGYAWSTPATVMIGDQDSDNVAGVYTGNEYVLAFSSSVDGVGSGSGSGDVVMTGSRTGEVWYSGQVAVDAGDDLSYDIDKPDLYSSGDGSYMLAWLKANSDFSDTGLYFARCSYKSYYSGDSSVVRASAALSAAVVLLSSIALSA